MILLDTSPWISLVKQESNPPSVVGLLPVFPFPKIIQGAWGTPFQETSIPAIISSCLDNASVQNLLCPLNYRLNSDYMTMVSFNDQMLMVACQHIWLSLSLFILGAWIPKGPICFLFLHIFATEIHIFGQSNPQSLSIKTTFWWNPFKSTCLLMKTTSLVGQTPVLFWAIVVASGFDWPSKLFIGCFTGIVG